MTRHRLRIQQFALTIRSTLHTRIIANNQRKQADRRAGLFRAFLARVDTTRTIGLLLDGISLAPVRGTSPGYTAEANASHHFDNHTNPRST